MGRLVDPLERIYRRVPQAQRQRLADFRAAHPEKSCDVGGVRWRYLVGGEGEEVLLILPGAACLAEPGFPLIAAFERDYRVIAPSYAPVGTMAGAVAGLAGVLAAEGIGRAHIFGGSFGGVVAQCFARQYPERARSLILANTTMLSRRWGWAMRMLAVFVARVPLGVIRAPVRWVLPWTIPAPLEEVAFWRAYQEELLTCRLTRADLLGLARTGADFLQHWCFAPSDHARWSGQVLLLASDRDAAARPAQRGALRRLYPRAQVHTFRDAGHTPWLTHHEEYVAVVRAFIAGVGPSPSS